MYYSKETTNTPIKVIFGGCPYCRQPSKLLLYKAQTSGCIWIFPYSGAPTYSLNCGNCFAKFKISPTLGVDIESNKFDDTLLVFAKDAHGSIHMLPVELEIIDKSTNTASNNINKTDDTTEI